MGGWSKGAVILDAGVALPDCVSTFLRSGDRGRLPVASLRGPPISEPPIASAVTRESAACEEQPAFRPQLPRAPSWRWSARSAVWLPVPHQQPLVSAAETGESGWFWGAEHNLQTAPRQQPSRWPKTPCAQQRHSAKQRFAHGYHGVGPSAEIRRGEVACAAGHQCMH